MYVGDTSGFKTDRKPVVEAGIKGLDNDSGEARGLSRRLDPLVGEL